MLLQFDLLADAEEGDFQHNQPLLGLEPANHAFDAPQRAADHSDHVAGAAEHPLLDQPPVAQELGHGTFCTAGSSSPMRIAMMAITTSSSMRVKAGRDVRRMADLRARGQGWVRAAVR